MVDNRIRTFDRAKYGSVPQLSAYGLLRLIRDLERVKPANAPDMVEKSATRMIGTAEELRAEVEGEVEEGAAVTGLAVEIDICVDKMWGDGANLLEHRIRYADPALAKLPKELRDEIDLDHRVEVADTARELKALLYSEGLEFLQAGFTMQAEQMAVRLDIVTKSPKAALYEEVLGEGLFKTLTVLQRHYDDMVHGRVTRTKSSGAIRELRYAAQRHATIYASAVMLMLDEDDPKSYDVVVHALTPIPSARVRPNQSPADERAELEEVEPAEQAEPTADDLEKTVAE